MSLKKIALIALIVVMLASSIIAFGCKPKAQDEMQTDTTMVAPTDETPAVADTTMPPAEPAPATE